MPTWRNRTQAELDRSLNNSEAIPGWYQRWWPIMVAARTRVYGRTDIRRDLAYGDAPRQRLDFFPSGRPGAPTFAFIHGGYWQSRDKEDFALVAEGPLAAGINVALIEYTLVPHTTMTALVEDVRAATRYLAQQLPAFGADPARLIVGGHSAGGHLAAMVADLAEVHAILPLSGLFDLEPIRQSYLNKACRMDEGEAHALSPLHHLPPEPKRMAIGVGAGELDELRWQTEAYAEATQRAGWPVTVLALEQHHHFSVLAEFAGADGVLTKAIVELGR
jgi:acetyl esterase/lipase